MFRNYSISKKLTMMNMLVSGAALLTACAAFVAVDLATFRANTVNNLSAQAQIAGSNSVSALIFDDPDSAWNTLSALKAAPNIISSGIYTADARSFASYWRDRPGLVPALPPIPPGQIQAYRFDGNQVVLVRSLASGGKPIGLIYLQSDAQALNARLIRYAGISAVVLVASLLAALMVSSMFRRAVAEPIIHLANVAQAVSRDKNYSVRATPSGSGGELAVLVGAFNEMLSQIQVGDAALQRARDQLEFRVEARTRELAAANKELEAFSYSVSHDLRAPLRSIDGFSQALLEDCSDMLDSNGKAHLYRVRAATQRMALLIDDLLDLARVARSEMEREKIDLSGMVRSIADDLQKSAEDRRVQFVIAEGLSAEGDSRLLRVVMENLLRNAWKFTSRHDRARIEFGRTQDNGSSAYFVSDDGAGFDPRHAARLFGAFQRLHAMNEFPGTGVGLATVQRIIHRHGGRIWADAMLEKGATFYFTL